MQKRIIVFLFSVLYFGFSYNQDPKWSTTRINTRPLEEYSQLPMGVGGNYTNSSRSIGSYTISQNYRVHPSLNHQIETPITRHPLDLYTIFASAITFNVGGSTGFSCGYYLTTNSGYNWFGSDTTRPNYGDPAPVIDYTGRMILCSVTPTGSMGACYSTNNGLNWSNIITFPGASNDADKELAVTDPDPHSLYYGRTYCVFTDFGGTYANRIMMSYTTNGGVSWSNSSPISPPTTSGYHHQGCDVITLGNDVFVSWANCISQGQNATEDSLGFARSTNGGVSWITSSNHVLNMNGIRTSNLLPNGSTIRANGFSRIAVDRLRNIIYVTTAEKYFSPAIDGADVVLMKSTNFGNSWIRTKVNTSSAGSYEWFPVIRVDEAGGVNICYYSTRNTPTNDSAEVYLSRSTDGGISFEDIKISDHKFRPVPVLGIAAGYSGDYIGITSGGNGELFPYWCEQGPVSGGRYQAWTATVDIGTILSLRCIQEGFYNSSSKKLRMKDTLRVQLRNEMAPFNLVDSAITMLDSVTYTTQCLFNNLSGVGNYWCVVKHRNSVETWSHEPITISASSTSHNEFDLITSDSNSFDHNQVQVDDNPEKWAMYSGDVNQDGNVDLIDVLSIYNDAKNFTIGYVKTDVNGDRIVDLVDQELAYNNVILYVSVKKP